VDEKPSKGWFLALRYLRGAGIVPQTPGALPLDAGTPDFIFVQKNALKQETWDTCLKEWFDRLAFGGVLALWVPDCLKMSVPDGQARLTLELVERLFESAQGIAIDEADEMDGYLFFVARKTSDARHVRTPWRKQRRHVLVYRTGAFGDALMAASVLPALKAEGWAVSFLTNERGADVLRGNPYIDELIVLHAGQVVEKDKPRYIEAMASRFDRLINMTQSVEGELLKHPACADYWWSDKQRRDLCGKASYLERIHALADVPGPYRVRFYPSAQEQKNATRTAERLGDFVVWALKGSALHKWWPFTPQAVVRLMARCSAHIVLTGDVSALPLADAVKKAVADYYGDTSRLSCCVGTHSIRDMMALAMRAAVVVGPETGLMHAVSMEKVPKVVLLSHSSTRNLTDDWVATTSVCPRAACYPCHRLHLNHDWCPQDPATGAAACAASISVERVVGAILKAFEKKKKQEKEAVDGGLQTCDRANGRAGDVSGRQEPCTRNRYQRRYFVSVARHCCAAVGRAGDGAVFNQQYMAAIVGS
jgi:ADP-heptose:LPS heptosyltransferase